MRAACLERTNLDLLKANLAYACFCFFDCENTFCLERNKWDLFNCEKTETFDYEQVEF